MSRTQPMPRWQRTRRSALSVVALAGAVALGACTEASGTEVTSEPTPAASAAPYVYGDTAAGYRVTFPGTPSIQTIPVAGTGDSMDMAVLDLPVEQANLVAQALDTGTHVVTTQLRSALENAVTQLGPAVTEPGRLTPIEVGGASGLSSAVTLEGSIDGLVVVLSDGTWIYQLSALGGTAELRAAFIESFELVG